MSTSRDEPLHGKAVEEVRAAYEMADRMRTVDLAAVNRVGPPTQRYRAQYELVREFLGRAGAMLDLAGRLGLIDADEDAEIRRSVAPELTQWLEDEDKRLAAEA